MKLILFSHPGMNEKELDVLAALEDHSLFAFHLRKPAWKIHEVRSYLDQFPPALLGKTVLHDHFDLAEEFHLKGVHLSEKNRAKYQKEQLRIPESIKLTSTSFHTVLHLMSNQQIFEYVFLSPVFDSISKHGYFAAFNLHHLKFVLPRIKQHVIALGGINGAKIRLCEEMGFKGIAVLGSVWQSSDPLEAVHSLQKSIN